MDYTKVINGKYFPYIDGIRSLAIIPVLLYHLHATLCPGGFVGVDVFFVISGYLISGGLLKSFREGNYRIGDFYQRRVRRIIPEYIVMICLVLMTCMFLYGIEQLRPFVHAAFWSSLFSGNVYFYLNTGYFDAAAESNPFLHLWSLGVEEQFYLIIPFILFYIYRFGTRAFLTVVVLLWSLSLLLSLGCNFGLLKQSFNFYLLPTRSWELLTGTLLAYAQWRYPVVKGKSLVALVAFAVVLAVCFLYDSHTAFPGYGAIPPVLATAAIIRYGSGGLIGRFLSSAPMTWVGKISYSVYLWHWPLIVIANYLSDDSDNPVLLAMTGSASIVLGWLSWRYVGMPVRLMKSWNKTRATAVTVAGMACVCALSYITLKTSIPASKYTISNELYWGGKESTLASSLDVPCNSGSPAHSTVCVLGQNTTPSYVLWGDSHAMALSPGFDIFSQNSGINGIYINCRQVLIKDLDEDINIESFICIDKYNSKWLENTIDFLVKLPSVKYVVLVNRWSAYCGNGTNESKITKVLEGEDLRMIRSQFKNGLEKICRKIILMGKLPVIISPIPEQGFNTFRRIQKAKILNLDTTLGCSHYSHCLRQNYVNGVLRDIEKEGLAHVIEVDDFFFPDGRQSSRIISKSGDSLYHDDNHLNPSGAIELIEFLAPQLKEIFQSDSVYITNFNKIHKDVNVPPAVQSNYAR